MAETIEKKKKKIDYKKLNDNKRFCNIDLIQEISDQIGVSEDLVKQIVEAQSKHTAETIRSGGMKTVIFVYLGKFKVNPLQVQKMMGKSMKG